MNSSGIVTVIKQNFLLPSAFQQLLLTECPHGFGYSVAEGNNTLESGFFDTKGEKIEEIVKTLDELNTKFKDKKLVLFFNRMEDPPELCQQPTPILTSKAGSILINAFTDGEFKKYESDEEFDPGTAFLMRFLGDEISRKFEECGKSLDKLFTELAREDYRKDLWAHMEPRGVVMLHDTRGQVLTLSRSNKDYGEYEWGVASNSLGYKEEKPAEKEEPKEEVMPAGLNFMQQRKWIAEHKGKTAAAAPATKPKEVATAKAADTSKSSVEKHPEGGTKTELPTNLRGILDGRVVRPDVSLQDRNLKDWYKVHDKDGCPQNFKQARPGIPFERLKVESSIRKFLESSGLFASATATKTEDKKPATGGLTPSQIASAVIVHKGASYVVDPLQFAANEKENPTFLQRLEISDSEFVRMSLKDKVAILEIVGKEEFMRGISVLCATLQPDLIKPPVETVTQDEKVEPEPEKELSFLEKRKLAAQNKAKVA
jgi:hypothetical protein